MAREKSLPPHLCPLPSGEEEPFGSVGADNRRGRFMVPLHTRQLTKATHELHRNDAGDLSPLTAFRAEDGEGVGSRIKIIDHEQDQDHETEGTGDGKRDGRGKKQEARSRLRSVAHCRFCRRTPKAVP